jgi:signal transduction histidine kinase
MMMKSLLNKSLSQFIGFTAIILLLTLPLFYLLTKRYYAEELMDVIQSVHQGQGIPPLDLEQDIMVGLIIQFLLIFSVLSLSMLVTLRFITRRLWGSFNDTLRKIEQFNLEQNDVPTFLPTRIKEFARLNDSVEQLIRKTKKSYQLQKEFTENASHELQTPIAIVQGKLDLLLQENLDERQSHIVSDLYKVNLRMSRLNKNLLLLARIENSQYEQMDNIELVGFVRDLIPLYEGLQGRQTLKLVAESPRCMIKANSSLLESLLNNLVVNAIRHSVNDSAITISICGSTLSVSNEANNGPLDSQHIFQRFHFSDDQSRGNGLGLAIVKAICNYHGWQVSYTFENNRHCFEVDFIADRKSSC